MAWYLLFLLNYSPTPSPIENDLKDADYAINFSSHGIQREKYVILIVAEKDTTGRKERNKEKVLKNETRKNTNPPS